MKRTLLVVTFLAAGGLTARSVAATTAAPLPVVNMMSTARVAPPRVVLRSAPGTPAYHVILPPTITPPPEPRAPNSADCNLVGYINAAAPGMLNPVAPAPTPDGGTVRRIELTSQGAKGLRVQFKGRVETGTEIRAYAPASSAAFGPLSSFPIGEDGTWWSPVIFGDSLGLEFYAAPCRAAARFPEIAQVTYIYGSVQADGPAGGKWGSNGLDCELDVTCSPTWSTEKDGVAKMFFNCTPTSCSICTGSLLNRDNGDQSPIFLTANHCISTQAAAATLTTLWFYQTPTCNGAVPDPNTLPQTSGALLLKNYPYYDCTILGLSTKPPAGATFLAWNPGAWPYGDAVVGIHHPHGEYKRIAFGSLTDSGIKNFAEGIGDVSVWFVNYNQGTVEKGSSGSPLFDSAHRVRGPLTGGDAEICASTEKYYGRFDLAYPTLQPYLATVASPMYVDHGFAGSETGANATPFNTVYEASFAVRASDTVAIAAGNYPENVRIWRPMKLTTRGGIVRIGQ